MLPTAALDAGPICLQRSERIAPDDDYGSLAARLAALAGELMVEALDTQPAFREQPDQGVAYADKIEPEDRLLDPTRAADQLERRVRALTPQIGAYVPLEAGERLGVRRAALAGRGRGRASGRRLAGCTGTPGRSDRGPAAGKRRWRRPLVPVARGGAEARRP